MLNRRQDIIWTNADLIHWCIYAALGGDELIYSLGLVMHLCIIIIPPAQQSCWGGYIGFTPSVRLSVRPSRIPCPLCSFYSSGWIHFIFIHLIKQLQKVCRVWNFGNFFKICNFDFVLFWLGIWCESLVWVIMGRRGVSQNAGVLVVFVGSGGRLSRVAVMPSHYLNKLH